jgi:tetratricopeptide (TPR) repeat protein
LGVAAEYEEDTGAGLALVNTAVEVLRDIDDQRALCMALVTKGRLENKLYRSGLSEVADGIATIAEGVRISRQLNDHVVGVALRNFAWALERLGRATEAILAADEAARRLAGSNEALSLVTVRARVHHSAGNVGGAYAVVSEGITTARSSGDLTAVARMLNVLASLELKDQRFADALGHARESAELAELLGERRQLAHAYHTLGNVLTAVASTADAIDEALACLRQAALLLEEIGDRQGLHRAEASIRNALRLVRRLRSEDTDPL